MRILYTDINYRNKSNNCAASGEIVKLTVY